MVRERGVSVAQARLSRDIDVHENVVRKWVKEFGADPKQAFPGHGQMKPEQLEIDRLRREVAKAQGGARHPKKGRSLLTRGSRHEVRLHCRSTVPSGRWHGFAKRLAYRGLASMPG